MSKLNLPKIKTPYYIINENKLKNNYYELKQAFDKRFDNVILGYSFKTNSLPWILNWMRKNGAYAEVVSNDEYELALEVGFKDEEIIFNGPVKEKNMLKRAVLKGAIVNIDSFSEINYLINNISKENEINVGLRVNFDLEAYCPGETIVGNEPGRFGLNLENGSLEKAINILSKYSNINITGIHLHNSTKTKSLNIFNALVKKIAEIKKMFNKSLKYIDIGGSFFGDKPGAPSFEEYAQVLEKLNDYFNNSEITIILEPGAAIIASPIEFVCSVIDVKEVKEKKIISTDGSCHNINPSMSGVKFYVESNSEKSICKREQIICGYTCIEKDRMACLTGFPELEENNLLKFYNVGAYTMSLEPLFIKYYPAVVVNEENKFYYARMPWGIKEYMTKCFLNSEKQI